MSETRFWDATERHEQGFTGTADLPAFRRAMRRLGHDNDAIRERVEATHPELLTDFDRRTREKSDG